MTHDPSTYSPEMLVAQLQMIAIDHERKASIFAKLARRVDRRIRGRQGPTKAQLAEAAKLGAFESSGGMTNESERTGELHDKLYFTAEVLRGTYVLAPDGDWVSLEELKRIQAMDEARAIARAAQQRAIGERHPVDDADGAV